MRVTRQGTRRKKGVSITKALFIVFFALAIASALLFYSSLQGQENPEKAMDQGSEYVLPDPVLPICDETELSIVCVGDIMIHKSQIASQYNSSTGTYNYDNNFQYVKEYIQSADLAICNVNIRLNNFQHPSNLL
jgi:hypothetical protein